MKFEIYDFVIRKSRPEDGIYQVVRELNSPLTVSNNFIWISRMSKYDDEEFDGIFVVTKDELIYAGDTIDEAKEFFDKYMNSYIKSKDDKANEIEMEITNLEVTIRNRDYDAIGRFVALIRKYEEQARIYVGIKYDAEDVQDIAASNLYDFIMNEECFYGEES